MYYSTGHYTRQISSNLHFTFCLLWVHYRTLWRQLTLEPDRMEGRIHTFLGLCQFIHIPLCGPLK